MVYVLVKITSGNDPSNVPSRSFNIYTVGVFTNLETLYHRLLNVEILLLRDATAKTENNKVFQVFRIQGIDDTIKTFKTCNEARIGYYCNGNIVNAYTIFKEQVQEGPQKWNRMNDQKYYSSFLPLLNR